MVGLWNIHPLLYKRSHIIGGIFLMEWVMKNVEWVFSGIGVLVISVIGGMFFKKEKNPKQNINSGDNSTNIQGSKNVNVTFGEKNE